MAIPARSQCGTLQQSFIISTQPRSQLSFSDLGINVCSEEEKVIFEAVCNVDSLQDEIKDSFFDLPLRLAVLASLYLVFCSIPLGVYCRKRVSDSWRLFLTKSGISISGSIIVVYAILLTLTFT